MDFNDDCYLFYSIVSDSESYDENVYYLKLSFYYYGYTKNFCLTINSDEADYINSMILEFRALLLGMKEVNENEK